MAVPIKKQLERFLYFIEEREHIRIQKDDLGKPAPWTKDRILRDYRFCNVRRADDRITKWIGKWVSDECSRDEARWFWFAVARWFNEPDTLQELTRCLPGRAFYVERAIDVLQKRKERGDKIFNAAYIITGAVAGKGKQKYVAVIDGVLAPLWNSKDAPNLHASAQEAWKNLQKHNGMGSFMAGQVVADWVTFGVIKADDRDDWAPLGPGSRRGLAAIYGDQTKLSQEEGVRRMLLLSLEIKNAMPRLYERMTLHDVQNCLCEYSKYHRGYGKQNYEGSQSELPF